MYRSPEKGRTEKEKLMTRRATSSSRFAQHAVVYEDRYNLVSGPEKRNLIDALDRFLYGARVGFTFLVGEGLASTRAQIMVRITGLEHAGGNSEHFYFKGITDMPSGEERRIEGYYVPFTHHGHFSVK
jgi:hypothetical protein